MVRKSGSWDTDGPNMDLRPRRLPSPTPPCRHQPYLDNTMTTREILPQKRLQKGHDMQETPSLDPTTNSQIMGSHPGDQVGTRSK